MSFSLFNISLLAQINKDIKFESFSHASYTILKETNEYFKNISDHYLGLSGKTTEHYKKTLSASIQKTDSRSFRACLQDYKLDCALRKRQREYEARQRFFNSDVWQQWTCTENKNALDRLYSLWDKNRLTSHMPSEALIAVTQKIIPVYEDFCKLASIELQAYKKDIPKQVKEAFQNYIWTVKKEIQTMRHGLCDGMLSRLELSQITDDPAYDDITHYVSEGLNQIGVAITPMVSKRSGIDKNTFEYFHYYILRKGTLPQQMQLKKLKWLSTDENFTSQIVDNQFVIVPKEMEQFRIPSRTKNYFWFQWPNFRVDFFKKQFYDLARVRYLKNYYLFFEEMTVKQLCQKDILQDLASLENKWLVELQHAKTYCSSWINKILFSKQCMFYSEWQKSVYKILQEILSHKINYATVLAKKIQVCPAFELHEENIASEEVKKRLMDILNNIESTLKLLSKEQSDQWINTQKNLLLAVQSFPNPTLKNETQAIETKTNISSTGLLISRLTNDESTVGTSITENAIAKEGLEIHLQRLIKNEIFAINNNKKFAQQLLQLNEKLPFIANDEGAERFWKRFFVTYLKTQDLQQDEYKEIRDEILKLMFVFAPTAIRERADLLEKKRLTESSFLHRTRCQAMLFSFSNAMVLENDATSTSSYELNDGVTL